MPKSWKSKAGANTSRNRKSNDKCNNLECKHCCFYFGCGISLDFRTCDLYHVRKGSDKRIDITRI
jgi:hypothetical protein